MTSADYSRPGTRTVRFESGVFQLELGGTGQLWRATSWQAALTAAQLLDYDPHAMQVAVSVEGKIDGPSAGALFTVGILAAAWGTSSTKKSP